MILRYITRTFATTLFAASVVGAAGCSGDDGRDGEDGMDGEDGEMGEMGDMGDQGARGEPGPRGDAGPGVSVLRLSFTGLENLGADYAYEGWVIVDGSPVSTGVFHVNDEGQQTDSTFAVDSADLAAASTFVLTIEPVPDDDPAPSHTHLLGGDFDEGSASLSVGHAAALNDDFSEAVGRYILETPSSTPPADYANGVWWLDPAGAPDPSLELPTLPQGWVYEGWVVDPTEGPISTGTFTMVSGADSDEGGPAAGPNDTPPFPGQDFIDPATTLGVNTAVVISIEPDPDNSPAPFLLKPLVDMAVEDVGAGVLQNMMNNAESFPAGTANR